MSKPGSDYTVKLKRTLESLKEGSTAKGKSRLGSLHPPLLKVPTIDHVVVDELHLLLRIFDVLLRNLIFMAIQLDQHQKSDQHLLTLKTAIRSCGVTFEIWPSDDKKNSSNYEWTSLTGRDRKKVLKVCTVLILFLYIIIYCSYCHLS